MGEVAELLEGCADAALAGAAVLEARWGKVRTIDKKGAIDLVTDADRASEEAVLALLSRRFPKAAVLAEESGAGGAAGGGEAGRCFVVDPLDGTTNYAHGLPHFAVTVAVRDAAGVVAGATCDPLRRELFLASRGGGATLGGVPLRCSGCTEVGEALLVTGFPYDVHREHEGLLRTFGAFVTQARGVRRFGSAALDLAYVAAGRFDGFWEAKLKPWDLAAGLLLAREAGARVTDLAGGDRVLETGGVVAAAPGIHPRMLDVIRGT